jgi:nucleoside-diphosphate-sugar epimerase
MHILVAGAGGFIGGHLTTRLVEAGHQVRAVDVKPLDEWLQISPQAENVSADLSDKDAAARACAGVDDIYNLAADMGGMGFIESHKAACMLSSLINTHLLLAARDAGARRFFYASSACVYASWHQGQSADNPLKEEDAYPADPEDGYGWEKLFSERMTRHFNEDFGLDVRIARFHNVYGPHGTYDGGREKAPAAACRKVAELALGRTSEIQIWGDGRQVRSFTYIDDCVDGVLRLMDSGFTEPINIGSSEAVTIQRLYDITARVAGLENIAYSYDLSAPLGVQGRSSDNTLCRSVLGGWEPHIPLTRGMADTYGWVLEQVKAGRA